MDYASIFFWILTMVVTTSVILTEHNLSILFSSLIFLGIGLVLVSVGAKRNHDRNYLFRIFLTSYSIRILVAVLVYFLLIASRGEPFFGGGDDKVYYLAAEEIRTSHYNINYFLNYVRYTGHMPGYPFTVASLSFLFKYLGGSHLLSLIFFNCLIGSLIPVYTYRIASCIYSEKTARLSALLTMLFPSLIFFSAILLKDIMVTFFVVLILLGATEIILHGRYRYVIIVLGLLVILYYFRPPLFILMSSFVGLCFLTSIFHSETLQEKTRRILGGALVLILIVYVLFSFVGFNFFDYATVGEESWTERSISAGSRNSLTAKVYQLPYFWRKCGSLIIVLIAPFPPWQSLMATKDKIVNLVFRDLGAIYWYLLIPYWLMGILYSFREKRITAFPIYSFCLVFPIAMVLSGAIDDRWRLVMMPAAFVLSAAGFQFRQKFRLISQLYIIIFLLFMSLYLVVKYYLPV